MSKKVPNTVHNSFHSMTPKGMDSIIFFCCKEEADLRLSKLDLGKHAEDCCVKETRFGWVIEHNNGECGEYYALAYFGLQFEHPLDEFIGEDWC